MASNLKNMKISQSQEQTLRDMLEAERCIKALDDVEQKIDNYWKVLGPEQVQALKLKADLNFNKLNKVLPDIKAIEVSGEIEVINFEQHYFLRPKEVSA